MKRQLCGQVDTDWNRIKKCKNKWVDALRGRWTLIGSANKEGKYRGLRGCCRRRTLSTVGMKGREDIRSRTLEEDIINGTGGAEGEHYKRDDAGGHYKRDDAGGHYKKEGSCRRTL